MGQAKQRGTFEERKAQAAPKNKSTDPRLERIIRLRKEYLTYLFEQYAPKNR